MISNRYSDAFFVDTEFTALSAFTAEASLLSGGNRQPVIPPGFFATREATVRTLRVTAQGVMSSTGTPNYTFTMRIGATAASLGGTQVGVTEAIVTGSGVSNEIWRLTWLLICSTPGIGAGNATMNAAGVIESPGFAAPYIYPIEPTAPDTANWTVGIQGESQLYFNLSVACSASDVANSIRCKQLVVESLN